MAQTGIRPEGAQPWARACRAEDDARPAAGVGARRVPGRLECQPGNHRRRGRVFLMPADLVPDFILGFGFADDPAAIAWVLGAVRDELTNFKA